jgi:hypothetical protein
MKLIPLQQAVSASFGLIAIAPVLAFMIAGVGDGCWSLFGPRINPETGRFSDGLIMLLAPPVGLAYAYMIFGWSAVVAATYGTIRSLFWVHRTWVDTALVGAIAAAYTAAPNAVWSFKNNKRHDLLIDELTILVEAALAMALAVAVCARYSRR